MADFGPAYIGVPSIRHGKNSKADTETIETGLGTVDVFVANASTAGYIVTVTSISAGTVTIGLTDYNGTTVAVAEDIYWIAVGRP